MKIEIKPAGIDDLLQVEQQIPEFSQPRQRAQIAQRLTGKQHLLLVAYAGEQPLAYKLGYALDDQEFYSWLGAVIPQYRGHGIAKLLLFKQEQWCRQQGFAAIRVKSRNRFNTMLLMLISHGYHIVKCEPVTTPLDYKIHFYKTL